MKPTICLKKTRFRPSSDLITSLKGDNHGGNGGCTNNLRTFPGLLATSCWTDYGSGTGAGFLGTAMLSTIAEIIRDLLIFVGVITALLNRTPEGAIIAMTVMSALGHKRTWRCVHAMSALPPKADIANQSRASSSR